MANRQHHSNRIASGLVGLALGALAVAVGWLAGIQFLSGGASVQPWRLLVIGVVPAVALGIGWTLETLAGPFFSLDRPWLFVPAGALATVGLFAINEQLTGFVAMTPWVVVVGYWMAANAHGSTPGRGGKHGSGVPNKRIEQNARR